MTSAPVEEPNAERWPNGGLARFGPTKPWSIRPAVVVEEHLAFCRA